MKLILRHEAAIARWVGDRVGIDDFGLYKAIGIADENGLIAGVIYNNFRPGNIEATIASISPRWCTRSILHDIFHYPFRQIGCRRITALTEDTNQPARAFLCRLGFQQEGVLRQAFQTGRDAVIYGMLADECRWLGQQGNDRSKAA